VSPQSVDEIAKAISCVVANDALGKQLGEKDWAQAQLFTREKAARVLLQIMGWSGNVWDHFS
jgi:hypothetical protein